MCGFSGITQKNECFINKSEVLFASRAYDGGDRYISNEISIYHAHLKITDLDKDTSQPYETQNLVLSFVGEIYNKEYLLGQCGIKQKNFSFYTENQVFALIFALFGIQGLSQVNGEFVITIFDKDTGKTYLSRDRYGTKSLYYKQENGVLSFASEIKILVSQTSEISEEALYDSLIFGFSLSPHTPIKNIFSLLPGSILTFDTKVCVIELFDSYHFQETGSFIDTFESAVMRRIPPFQEKILFPLSGGADSNLTLFFLKKHFSGEIISYSFLSNINQEDVDIASYNAKIHRVKHYIISIESYIGENNQHIHESLTDLLNIGKIVKTSIPESHDIKVEFSGDGREELFLGNTHFNLPIIQQKYEYIRKKYQSQQYEIDIEFLNKNMFDFNLQLLEKVTLGNAIERRIPFTDNELLRFAGQSDLYTIVSRKHLLERGFKIVSQIYGHNNAIHFSYPEMPQVLSAMKQLQQKLTSLSGKY